MLKFDQLTLRRGGRALLQNVTCTIYSGQRVGVTGANGCGKSSLFALIRNELHADDGDFYLPQYTVIAHVAQETPASDQSALDYVMDGDRELRQVQQRLSQAEQANDGETLGHLYGTLEAIDGYSAASRAGKLLHGLGFSSEQEQSPVRAFSGGWRMRLNLAQALMCRSDLLLLDEPTNHLDLEAVIWLEEWLLGYQGTLLLISHDRDFLDRVTTHIAHIENHQLTIYSGNYSSFEAQRAEQLANQQAAFDKQQREIAHIQSFVARFQAKASKARQAQSRLKALERMTLISAAHVDSPFQFQFRTPDKLPDPLLQLDKVDAGYGTTTVLKAITLSIQCGSRIGLLGYNGAGKSTLIKLLAGAIAPTQGERIAAKHLNVGYFAQHQLEQLDHLASPLLHLQRLDPQATESDLRAYLGGFGFRDDMATSPVAPFSGGEKARLVLAILVYQKPNLLLLDEPTNHLDLNMRHALTVALQEYEGGMVIVSHDRHLLRTVTDTLVLVADSKATPFNGDVDDYRLWVREQNKLEVESGDGTSGSGSQPTADSTTPSRKQQRQNAAALRHQLQPLQKKLKQLEQHIEKLETERTQINTLLTDNSLYEKSRQSELQTLLTRQSENRKELALLEERWLVTQDQLDELLTNSESG